MNGTPVAETPEETSLLRQRVLELGRTFRAAGRRLYLVGGSVRDTLLGRPGHDLDLTTDAPPAEIKRLLQRVRPDAIYDVGARFGTVGAIFRDPDGSGPRGRI